MGNGNLRSSRRQRGFTLAEILVTTAIFAIIMIAALAVYDQSNKVFKTSTESADMQQSTRIGFEKLVADLRMAGFDYNRGGYPTETWQASQPDEQIEYAGPTAVVFRANFNYNTAAAQNNGLEPAYTPLNTSGQAIFPFVTTSNSEIVAYVLQSTQTSNPSANTGSISFYVDDYKPRAAFPSSVTPPPVGTNPSHAEAVVTIPGIDLTNQYPPYTLYRVTLADTTSPHTTAPAFTWTPVAENIRSLNFQYYTDLNGATLLTNPDGSQVSLGRDAGAAAAPSGDFNACVNANGAPVACPPPAGGMYTGAIGGDGQYDPNNIGAAANYADRAQRSLIASVRTTLVGMNASPDLQGYSNATETIASIKNYREYSLSSLIVPRNLGMTGFPEPSYNPPGPPTITGMCLGYCGAPVIYWQPPAAGGPVVSYQISWDTSPNGSFSMPHQFNVNNATATSAVLPDDGVSDVSQTWYYRIVALNDNGQSLPSALYTAVPQNNTTPQAVSNLAASSGQPNRITLTWTSPTQNSNTLNTLSCTGTGGSTDGSLLPPGGQELLKYRVWRGETPNFQPGSSAPGVDPGVMVLDFWSTTPPQPAPAPTGSMITWIDSPTTSLHPPANCKTYYYRVRIANRCAQQNTWNYSGNSQDAYGDFYPPLSANAISGSAASPVTPSAPNLNIDLNPGNTGCPDPQNMGSPNCRVTLRWTRVTTDTGGNATAIDSYRITRSNRIYGSSGVYVPDLLFGPGGQQVVTCSQGTCSYGTYSQTGGGQVTFADTPPEFQASSTNQLQYQYTVAALGCSNAVSSPPQPNDPYSVESNPVQYPGCTGTYNIAETGGTGSGNGRSYLTPWILNGGDQIIVNSASGPAISTVQFVTTVYPSGTPVPALSPPPIGSPGNGGAGNYVLTWADQSQGTYQVQIVVTDTTGCSQSFLRYVEEQPPAPCSITNQAPPNTALTVGTGGGPNVLNTVTETFTVPNLGTDKMLLASHNIKLTWQLPAGDTNHTDLTLASLTWQTGAYSQSDNFSAALGSPAPTVTTRAAPATMPDVCSTAPVPCSTGTASSFTLTVTWQYHKRDDGTVWNNLTEQPLLKICIDYQVPSEPGVVKHCNLVGQSGSTSNPNACD